MRQEINSQIADYGVIFGREKTTRRYFKVNSFEHPNTRADVSRRGRVTDAARSLPWDSAIGQIVVESLCKTQPLDFTRGNPHTLNRLSSRNGVAPCARFAPKSGIDNHLPTL